MSADTLGGVWTYALELARALDTYGIHVILATMGRHMDEDKRQEVSGLGNVTIEESDFRLEWMENPWNDVDRSGWWLQDLASSYDPDIIHLNGFSHGSCMWRQPSLIVAHSCVYSWFTHVKKSLPPPQPWHEYRRRVIAGLRGTDIIISPSHAMADDIRKHYAVKTPIRTMYNGRRAVDFCPDDKKPYVFAAGRIWDEGKNLSSLARCASALSWPVYIAGESRHPDGHTISLDNVHLLGPLGCAAVKRWFAQAPIYALPARYEPFGLSALEAALSGCALVLGDIPSLREIWGDSAVYVSPEDVVALEKTIQKLINNPLLRHTLSRKSRSRALQLNSNRMAESYMHLYENLIATSTGNKTAMVG
ncbi:MAG: glycosyltransferase family 4 protein [Chitinivibrionales bacterium]